MKKSKQTPMLVKYPNCAGIDIAKNEHWVALPPDQDGEPRVRRFGGFTEDLHQLSEWFGAEGIEQVAMEATGVYWISAYELLERNGFEVWLVNPQQTKRRDGRKSDVLDCQWTQQLMCYGLLNRSHQPADVWCELRAYVRQRRGLMQDRGRSVQHMQKALQQMNIQLSSVLSDIAGKSGLAIVDAIVAGERDVEVLAGLCDRRVRASHKTVAASLQGNWRAEHLVCLQQALESYRHFSAQIKQLDDLILQHVDSHRMHEGFVDMDTGEYLEICAQQLNSPARSAGDRLLQLSLWRIYGVDLTAIPGISLNTTLTLLSEVGSDLSAFRTAAQFSSWLALAPPTQIRGGKRLSKRGPKRTQIAGQALRMAAMTLRFSHSPMGDKHRKRCLRLDTNRAIKVSAHELSRIIYAMITKRTEFQCHRVLECETTQQQRQLRHIRRRAKKIGYELVPLQKAA